MCHDLFTAADPTLQPLASDREVPTAEPLPVSPYVGRLHLAVGTAHRHRAASRHRRSRKASDAAMSIWPCVLLSR